MDGVVAFLLPTGNQVGPLFEHLDDAGNFRGIILQIGIHGNDELSPATAEAFGKRRGLAAVAPELDALDARIFGGKGLDAGEGAVLATVIDDEDFEPDVLTRADFPDFLH